MGRVKTTSIKKGTQSKASTIKKETKEETGTTSDQSSVVDINEIPHPTKTVKTTRVKKEEITKNKIKKSIKKGRRTLIKHELEEIQEDKESVKYNLTIKIFS